MSLKIVSDAQALHDRSRARRERDHDRRVPHSLKNVFKGEIAGTLYVFDLLEKQKSWFLMISVCFGGP